MDKPRLLDLFCGAGGAGMGYHRAGFEVVGVDLSPMPRYPFEFHQGDALEYLAAHGHEFDAIHASPPCQGYSVTQRIHGNEYPMLIEVTREKLCDHARNTPWIMENVVGAPMIRPFLLCGTMFNLRVIRHRLFESNCSFPVPFHPIHDFVFTNSNRGYSSFDNGATYITAAGHNFSRKDAVIAFGNTCEWMTREELAEAIPPAYTEYIGKFLLEALGS